MRRRHKLTPDIVRSMSIQEWEWQERTMRKQEFKNEKEFQYAAEQYLVLRTAYQVHFQAYSPMWNRPGIPDLLVGYRGFFIGIELKGPRGATSAAQMREGEWIKASGCRWAVCRTIDEIGRQLDYLDTLEIRIPEQKQLE